MLPAPPFVAHDFNRHTCIAVRVSRTRVTYVPMDGLNLMTTSHDSFAATWQPMAHSVCSAAKVYMQASGYHKMSAGAFEQLQRLINLDPAVGRNVTPETVYYNGEAHARVKYVPPPTKEPKVRKPNTVFTLVPGAEVPKLPSQARVLLATLAAAGGTLTREQLLAKLDPDELRTKQPVQRILAFYYPQLVKLGLITVTEGA